MWERQEVGSGGVRWGGVGGGGGEGGAGKEMGGWKPVGEGGGVEFLEGAQCRQCSCDGGVPVVCWCHSVMLLLHT